MGLFDFLGISREGAQDESTPTVEPYAAGGLIQNETTVATAPGAAGDVVTITLDPAQSVGQIFSPENAVTPMSAMRISAAYACVRLVAGAKAGLPLVFFKRNRGAREWIDSHDLWWLLNVEPSPICTAAVFWEYIEWSRQLRGDGFAYIDRNRAGEPVELIPLVADDVEIVRYTDRKNRFAYRIKLVKDSITIDQDDVLHFRNFGVDWSTGKSLSTLQHGAREALKMASAADKHSESFFNRGTTSKVVLSYPNKLSPEQKDIIRDQFMQKYGGAENNGVPLVMGEGGSATTISINARDAQLLESRQYQVTDIARAFGVPPFMIGAMEKTTSWGSGISEMSQGFLNYTLSPHLIRDEQELVRKLFYKKNIYVEFDRDALLRSDFAKRSQYYRQAIGGSQGPGWLTINEVRRFDSMPPLAGGDVLFSGANVAPQDDLSAGAPDGSDNTEKDNTDNEKTA